MPGALEVEFLRRSDELFDGLANVTARASWKLKQTREDDRATRFIFDAPTLEELRATARRSRLEQRLSDYAEHRWRNVWRHDAWLYRLLALVPNARPFENPKDKTRDLYLRTSRGEETFDLKATRWPVSIGRINEYDQLARWMYDNQSAGRYHDENRLFIVADDEGHLYDREKANSAMERLAGEYEDAIFDLDLGHKRVRSGVIHVRG